MSVKKLSTVIMAAGKGKRMQNTEMSKVMHTLSDKPLIQYVVELSSKINSDLIILIVGHQKQSVIDFIEKKFPGIIEKIKFAHQDQQLGTGHAIMQTKEILENFEGNVLILSGDVPLLSKNTIDKFIKFHYDNYFEASLISAIFQNPDGYGRILRDEDGKFYDIREDKDCTDLEKQCKEINSGIYIIDKKILFEALNTLDNKNSQGEYYLTDVFKYFKSSGKKTGAFITDDINEITGINTIEQLEELEKEIIKTN